MRYLVDANVVCEPTKRFSVLHVVEWLAANESEIVADSVIMGEIWRGVDALPEGKKREALVAWFQRLLAKMPTLEWTTETALVWGEMVNEVKRSGYTVGLMDTMIAATAKRHHLIIATRNVDDFRRCGVTVFNPFDKGAEP
jgi:predicted nucleic acid-binding protein